MAAVVGLCKLNLVINKCGFNQQSVRHFKSSLKIKWVRPEKVPCIKPEMSGDLEDLGSIDMTQLPTPYKASKELESANEQVKRIFSLEFFPRQMLKNEYYIQYMNKVKSHRLDESSPEVHLARMTVKIRNLMIHVKNSPRDVLNKVRLKETIDKRNKYLSILRATDYKKFEWLLDRLNLIYKVFGFKGADRVERKKSLRRLTMAYIEKLKAERLAEYKEFLESQQENFLVEKIEKFLWMKQTEEEFGVEPTVTEADVEEVRKQLQDIQSFKPEALS